MSMTNGLLYIYDMMSMTKLDMMSKSLRKMLFALVVGTVVVFSSCEKVVFVDDEGASGLTDGVSQLTITTRGDGGSGEESVPQTQVYVFASTGECVEILTTDGDDNTASVQLKSGTYTLCAVGGNDLGRFTLPTQSEATPASVITLKEGKVMDSFFNKQTVVALKAGEDQNESIVLERMVACLNKVEIAGVPAEVTAVEVSLSPLYSAIRLDGTFPDSPLADYKATLTRQDDGTTWKASPGQLLFPSPDEPVVTVSFTTASGMDTYSYTMEEALEANHYYNLSGTFKSSKARLSVTLTAADWGDERDIDFEFKDTDGAIPEAGEYYKGYYVVSVDDQTRRAVLLSEHIPYTAPENGAEESYWRAELELRMAMQEKPEGVSGNWRLPTMNEVEIFTKDPQAVSFTPTGVSAVCFCEKDGKLYWAYTQRNDDGSYTFKPGSTYMTSDVRLRPVIDITY